VLFLGLGFSIAPPEIFSADAVAVTTTSTDLFVVLSASPLRKLESMGKGRPLK